MCLLGKLKNRRLNRRYRRKPPSADEIFFLPFLAELDDLESFETMLFFSKIFTLMTNPAGTIFLKKITWSQMIPNRVIRREIATKCRRETAVLGVIGGTTIVSSVIRVDASNSKNFPPKFDIFRPFKAHV